MFEKAKIEIYELPSYKLGTDIIGASNPDLDLDDGDDTAILP